MRYLALLAGSLALVGFAAGCTGPKHIVVKGQLLYKGQPYKGDAKGGIVIVFAPLDPGQTANSVTKANREDSTFTLTGPDGNGIPAGKYRISFNQMLMPPVPAEVQRMNETFDEKKSKIVREVKSSDETIVIELTRPEG